MLEALTAMNAENVTQSDSTIIQPPYKFLMIFPVAGAKTIAVKNEKDATVTITIPAGATEPFIVPGRVRKVLDTGTDLADANILGLR